MNLDDATQLVTTAGILYPAWWLKLDRRTQEATFAAWSSMLEDVPLAAGLAALKRHAATNKWPPSVAEIRAIVAESTHGRRRAGADAWGDVAEMRRPTLAHRGYGVDDPPPFEAFADPLVAHCVARLGWRELGNAPADDITARSQFQRLYDSLAASAAEDRAVASLPGVARPALPGGASPASALVGDLARRLTGGAS